MKKHTRLLALLLLAAMLVSLLAGCGRIADAQPETQVPQEEKTESTEQSGTETAEQPGTEPATRIVTDMYGREVEVPAVINTFICTGTGCLRSVSYLDDLSRLVGIEETDLNYEVSTKRDYAHVIYGKVKDLPVIGKGGGTTYTAYVEEIIKLNPDVIFTAYAQEALDQLSEETGIPIVCVRYGTVGFFADSTPFESAERIIAEVLGDEERCEELLAYVNECKADLAARTAGIPDSEKPRVYTGAVTFSGAHGFAGTYAHFPPFEAIGALNVTDETGEKSSFEVDLEKVVVWDPEIIFLDPGNMNLVNDEYASNPSFFESLSAVQNGEVYTMPSFNNYNTNVTYCIMDAYWAGKVIFPDRFADIEMREKSNEILETFLGVGFFDEMEADGLYYGKITIGG